MPTVRTASGLFLKENATGGSGGTPPFHPSYSQNSTVGATSAPSCASK